MSPRIRSAEESARGDREATKTAAYTAVADSTAPRDPHRRAEHYRGHLIDAHRTIETLQNRIKDVEAEREAVKRDREYKLSLCVTRTAAEEARRLAAAGMRERAATLMEGEHGEPTERSEAIRAIPDIKPKWS
ncbi:hypothetical protein DTW90_30570 [Neorhizobium sp. P12A]|uniref:hypothetical protein n=1 Tax=Neorhizobium sp. P12A TaxID=2268027 RepID=UPI0011EEBBA3|nr:hypothetical protein [Neorhizobium sp. P12A]KAA0689838.1 hypothetical protein DTW90_30570 [Neorhizobium sp. P12A]